MRERKCGRTHSFAVAARVSVQADVATNTSESDDIVLIGPTLGVKTPEHGKTSAIVNGTAESSEFSSKLRGQVEIVGADRGDVWKRKG